MPDAPHCFFFFLFAQRSIRTATHQPPATQPGTSHQPPTSHQLGTSVYHAAPALSLHAASSCHMAGALFPVCLVSDDGLRPTGTRHSGSQRFAHSGSHTRTRALDSETRCSL